VIVAIAAAVICSSGVAATPARAAAVTTSAVAGPATTSAAAGPASTSAVAGAGAGWPTLVVATDGHRGAAGTVADPLATVAQALARLPRGGTVQLRAGRYAERITLRHRTGITIRPHARERVHLDGTGLTPPPGRSAMVLIDGSTRITVSGLDISGYDTTSKAAMPIGVYVHGASSHVTISGLHVHSMGTYDGTPGSFEQNAHGIAVYGDDAHHAITDLTVTGNEVDHLALGASEAVVVNGNVDGWRITRNSVHDNDNIGIDAIGYEPTLRGAARYTQANRARHGEIADNTVTDTISRGNPSYEEGGSWCNCADGIYVDGGSHIRIERNHLARNDIGIEVAAENPRGSADHVVVASNDVTASAYVGIATGGYCDGGADCGGVQTGRSIDDTFVDNTLYDDNRLDDGSPEILVQYHTRGLTIENTIVYAANADHVLLATVPRAARDGFSRRPLVDHNLYAAVDGTPATASFGALGRTYTSWDSYRRDTGLDQHSRFLDPRLRAPGRGDLHLRADSPAVDAGAALAPRVVGTRDIDGGRRLLGRHLDIGADERR